MSHDQNFPSVIWWFKMLSATLVAITLMGGLGVWLVHTANQSQLEDEEPKYVDDFDNSDLSNKSHSWNQTHEFYQLGQNPSDNANL